jgi:aspartate racemase
MPIKTHRKRYGIVGGLGALACADLFFKLVKLMPASGRDNLDVIIEQHPFSEGEDAGSATSNHSARKLYVFDTIKSFEKGRVDAVILPCFISHTFLDELKSEIKLPVINLMEALQRHIAINYPEVRQIGVLTSDYVRKKQLFERYFSDSVYRLVYPENTVQSEYLMPAIYGPKGIKAGYINHYDSIQYLYRTCRDLLDQGAELIIPGFSEISLVIEQLREMGLPVLDTNQVYARFAADMGSDPASSSFKIGIVGGVGPAATADFMNKIIRNTKASRDQEHIKIIVENNPQIPDRTGNLIGDGPDPTIALYSTCKKLESNDASLIAIPCNTAHAYVERIQPYLSIPIVNMLYETREYIRTNYKGRTQIGLLATSGTVQSRVYHDAFAGTGFTLLTPDDAYQARVMESIYGKNGVKAGYSEGQCLTDLLAALHHLVDKGVEVIILGCTELPLILSENSDYRVGDRTVAILDPTEILARKCAGIGEAWHQNAIT